MNDTGNGIPVLVPAPWGLEERPKDQISSITKSISKIFKPNSTCLLTNERYKTYKAGFYSTTWVIPPGWDLGVLWGAWEVFFSCNRPQEFSLCILVLSNNNAKWNE